MISTMRGNIGSSRGARSESDTIVHSASMDCSAITASWGYEYPTDSNKKCIVFLNAPENSMNIMSA